MGQIRTPGHGARATPAPRSEPSRAGAAERVAPQGHPVVRRLRPRSLRRRRFSMAKLIYSAITSLDGYVADVAGNFDWAVPDEEVHAFVNGLERPIGTYLYGRRMYEVMVGWETAHTFADRRPVMQDFAQIW